MNFSNWAWPQWTWMAIAAISVVSAICNHGKPRSETDGITNFIGAVFCIWLLWCGGFWK